jgi:hypothetical protein
VANGTSNDLRMNDYINLGYVFRILHDMFFESLVCNRLCLQLGCL